MTRGIDMLVYVDSTAVGCQTGATLSMTSDSTKVSCKDTIWKTSIVTNKEWTVTADSLYTLDLSADAGGTGGFSLLVDAFTNSTQVVLAFKIKDETSLATGDVTGYSGNAYITSMDFDAPQEDSTTISITFEGDGALSETTKSV